MVNDKTYTAIPKRFIWAVDMLELQPWHQVLEIGCGVGLMAEVICNNLEDGKLVVTEKVRSRAQAIDRMVEFLVEFDELDDAMIVQNRTHITEQARLLQDRLSVEFPGRHFPYTMYGMALAVMIGGDATGVVVLEKETEGLEDQ